MKEVLKLLLDHLKSYGKLYLFLLGMTGVTYSIVWLIGGHKWASMISLLLIGMMMIIIILLQRGRGGGLVGAFGGMGGASAFGTRAGDAFTGITIVLAVVWVALAGVSGLALRAERRQARLNDPGIRIVPLILLVEGNLGAERDMRFWVKLDERATETVTVDFTIQSVTTVGTGKNPAKLDEDFRIVEENLGEHIKATDDGKYQLTIPVGETRGDIVVRIVGDDEPEFDEDFQVTLSNPTNAALELRVGVGRILNDDGDPPPEDADLKPVTPGDGDGDGADENE